MLMAATPCAGANELTDAMTSPDPRTKLQTGAGQAYHSRYGEPETQRRATEEPELDLPGFEYQRSELYDRSPLDETFQDDSEDSDALTDEDPYADPYAMPDDLPLLGKEHERPGVYYQDVENR
jgi:hypothetical protein